MAQGNAFACGAQGEFARRGLRENGLRGEFREIRVEGSVEGYQTALDDLQRGDGGDEFGAGRDEEGAGEGDGWGIGRGAGITECVLVEEVACQGVRKD